MKKYKDKFAKDYHLKVEQQEKGFKVKIAKKESQLPFLTQSLAKVKKTWRPMRAPVMPLRQKTRSLHGG